MKKLLLFLIISIYLFGSVSFDNVSSSFIQTITNDQNRTIIYKGDLLVADDEILWNYKEPIKKSVLIKSSQVIITEPELFQVTVIRQEEGINLKKIYQKSKEIAPNVRGVKYNETVMKLLIGKSFLKKITFQDELENQVVIEFRDTIHKPIPKSLFDVSIPVDYDVIYR